MKLTDLPLIAREMRAELPLVGRVERVLPNRLYVQLLRRDHQLQLTIGRPDCYPTYEDTQIIARAFGVDETAEPRVIRTRIGSQDGRTIPVYGASFAWRESAPTA